MGNSQLSPGSLLGNKQNRKEDKQRDEPSDGVTRERHETKPYEGEKKEKHTQTKWRGVETQRPKHKTPLRRPGQRDASGESIDQNQAEKTSSLPSAFLLSIKPQTVPPQRFSSIHHARQEHVTLTTSIQRPTFRTRCSKGDRMKTSGWRLEPRV